MCCINMRRVINANIHTAGLSKQQGVRSLSGLNLITFLHKFANLIRRERQYFRLANI